MNLAINYIFGIYCALFGSVCMAQQGSLEYQLSSDIKEISGLEQLNTQTLVAINDGGNTPDLFVMDLNGTIQKRVRVSNAENKDWEDLAADENYLYVGDFGNNLNQRRDLCIYKIKKSDVLEKSEVTAEKIRFNYKEQTAFPPTNKEKKYDAEGLICWHDTLWVFTKVNTNPWTGKALVYKIPTKAGNYTVTLDRELFVGADGWWSDAITAADIYKDKLYLSTYNRILIFSLPLSDRLPLKTINYKESTQKESILVKSDKTILVADEKQAIFGGGKLYYINLE